MLIYQRFCVHDLIKGMFLLGVVAGFDPSSAHAHPSETLASSLEYRNGHGDSLEPCTVFVSPAGSDTAAGSAEAPYRSIGYAAERTEPGSVVCVYGNDYATERVAINRSGLPRHRIVFRALEGASMRGFLIRADYVTIEGFDVTSQGEEFEIARGIYIEGHGVHVIGNVIHDLGRIGIGCAKNRKDEPPRCVDALIRDNVIHDIDGYGIWIWGRDHWVEGNDISRVRAGTTRDADGIRFFGNGHVFRRNYIHDIYEREAAPGNAPHSDCFQSYDDDNSLDPLENILFEGNYCHSDRHCIIISKLTGPPARNIMVRNNVCSSNKASSGFFIGHDTGQDEQIVGLTITNNLLFGDITYFGIYSDHSYDVTIQNNIFFGAFKAYHGTGLDPSRGFSAHHNLVDRDPEFLDLSATNVWDRVKLRSTSPAIDGGSEAQGGAVDILGDPRIGDGDGDGLAIIDIGPYEYAP